MEDKDLKRLVVLISGEGSNLQAILDNIAAGKLSANVVGVISDCADAGGLKKARDAGVPTAVVAENKYADKSQFNIALQQQVEKYQPGLVVLAGFMKILSVDFIQCFAPWIINIHPSLLPKFKGLNTHRRALAAGEQYHGASVHFVTTELDGGEIIEQAKIKINASDDEATLRARVLAEEHKIYWRAIQRIINHHREFKL